MVCWVAGACGRQHTNWVIDFSAGRFYERLLYLGQFLMSKPTAVVDFSKADSKRRGEFIGDVFELAVIDTVPG